MRTWWRNEPLSREQQTLLEALFAAHHESCFRPNVSTVTVINTAAGSNDVGKAIAAGILTTGGPHAPLEQTYEFLSLDNPAGAAEQIIAEGKRIPGWGNSFGKGAPDPVWKTVDQALRHYYSELTNDIDLVTDKLHALGRKVYPNPSAYTAACAIALDVPAKAAVCLFISARLDAWSAMAFNQLEKLNKIT